MSTLLEQLDSDLTATVEKARCSLVEIHNGHGGAGAGVVVSADGLIVTNAHVIGRRGLQVILHDKRSFPAQLVDHDREHDLALLAIQAQGLTPIEFGDSREIKPGEWVMAIGHPRGVPGAATAGIVIASGANFPEMRGTGRERIVASLHMRPGHSGGALVDGESRLVGINTLINGPDVGVAVPVHVVKEFLERSQKIKERQSPLRRDSVEPFV